MPTPDAEVEALLAQVRQGVPEAGAALFDRLYAELRSLAGRVFRSQRAGHSLAPTALVHEAYLKMVRPGAAGFRDRAHFLNVAARAMRQVLVNHARDRAALKRGGGVGRREPLTLVDLAGAEGRSAIDVLALEEGLEELARLDARQARIAELKLFAGLSAEEIAEVLGVSLRTVELDWRMAKDHLARHLTSPRTEA